MNRVVRFRYEDPRYRTHEEILIRADAVATMPSFPAPAPEHDYPWLGTIRLVGGQQFELLATLDQWQALQAAVLVSVE